MNAGRWVRTGIVLAALAAGCDEGASGARDGGMDAGDVVRVPTCPEDAATDAMCCPATWVAYARGGCGPAVLLCVPDGGAAPGACDGIDLSRPPPVRDEDGAESVGFFRQADGRIGGAWSRPWTCPRGWRQEPDGTCAPTLRDDCPVNTAPLPDGTCTDTGYARCGDGWPAVPDEARGQRIVYVRERASRTPDGTIDAPYPTLTEAIAANPEAKWFLLHTGRYRAEVVVTGEMHVLGACAAGVQLDGPSLTEGYAFLVRGGAASLQLRDLTIDNNYVAVYAESGASVTAQRVSVIEPIRHAFEAVSNGFIDVSNALIRYASSPANPPESQALVHASRSGRIAVRAINARGSAHYSLTVTEAGSQLSIENAAISESGNWALEASEGASLAVRSSAVFRSNQSAINLQTGGRAVIEDLWMRELRPPSTWGFSFGAVRMVSGASLDARRVSIRDAYLSGLNISQPNTRARLEDLQVQRVQSIDGAGGIAVYASNRAQVVIRGARLLETIRAAVMSELGADCQLDDLRVDGVRAQPDGSFGFGVAQVLGGQAQLRRGLIEHTAGAAVMSIGLPERVIALVPMDPTFSGDVLRPRISISDLIVRENTPLRGSPGFGIASCAGAVVDATRVALEDIRGVGIAATETGFATQQLGEAIARVTTILRPEDVPRLVALLGPTLDAGSRMRGSWVFARGVVPWQIGWNPAMPDLSTSVAAGIGAAIGPRSTMALTAASMHGGPGGNYEVFVDGTSEFDSLWGSSWECTFGSSVSDRPPTTLRSTLGGIQSTDDCVTTALPEIRVPLTSM